jgi:hypothetical protein
VDGVHVQGHHEPGKRDAVASVTTAHPDVALGAAVQSAQEIPLSLDARYIDRKRADFTYTADTVRSAAEISGRDAVSDARVHAAAMTTTAPIPGNVKLATESLMTERAKAVETGVRGAMRHSEFEAVRQHDASSNSFTHGVTVASTGPMGFATETYVAGVNADEMLGADVAARAPAGVFHDGAVERGTPSDYHGDDMPQGDALRPFVMDAPVARPGMTSGHESGRASERMAAADSSRGGLVHSAVELSETLEQPGQVRSGNPIMERAREGATIVEARTQEGTAINTERNTPAYASFDRARHSTRWMPESAQPQDQERAVASARSERPNVFEVRV